MLPSSRHPRLARLVAILALVSLAVASAATPALAVPGWTGPISLGGGSLWTSRLGVDADGRLHIVALADDGLIYRTNTTGTWRTTQLAFVERPYQDELAMAVTPAGDVYIAWARGCDCDAGTTIGIELLTNAKGGPNQGWPILSRTIVTGKAYEPSLQVVGGKVHLAYRMGGRIHYLTNANPSATWRDTLVSPKGTFASRPSLAVNPTKGVRIAYAAGGGIVLASNTGTHAAPAFTRERIPGAAGTSPSLALDAKRRPYVAWSLEALGCAAPAGCIAADPGPTAETGTFLVRKGSSGWVSVTSRRRVSAIPWGPQLRLDGNGAFHLFDGIHVISNASGTVTRPEVVPSSINDTASMALTAGGKARVIYLNDTDASGDTQALFLMKER